MYLGRMIHFLLGWFGLIFRGNRTPQQAISQSWEPLSDYFVGTQVRLLLWDLWMLFTALLATLALETVIHGNLKKPPPNATPPPQEIRDY